MPHEGDFGGGEGVGLVDEVAEGALRGQGFGGEGTSPTFCIHNSLFILPGTAGVFVAQGVQAGAGERLHLATEALRFGGTSSPPCGGQHRPET